jgi:hypothetical protein
MLQGGMTALEKQHKTQKAIEMLVCMLWLPGASWWKTASTSDNDSLTQTWHSSCSAALQKTI